MRPTNFNEVTDLIASICARLALVMFILMMACVLPVLAVAAAAGWVYDKFSKRYFRETKLQKTTD